MTCASEFLWYNQGSNFRHELDGTGTKNQNEFYQKAQWLTKWRKRRFHFGNVRHPQFMRLISWPTSVVATSCGVIIVQRRRPHRFAFFFSIRPIWPLHFCCVTTWTEAFWTARLRQIRIMPHPVIVMEVAFRHAAVQWNTVNWKTVPVWRSNYFRCRWTIHEEYNSWESTKNRQNEIKKKW